MEGTFTEKAKDYYETAIQVITSAKHKNLSTNDLINQVAWGHRAWLMGDKELATAVRATYILLEKMDKRLERLEQQMKR